LETKNSGINIGLVGYGYWGPNLVRNFAETCGASVVAVADLDRSKLASLARRYPAIKLTTDFAELLSDPNIDAIAVATPVHTHYELGLAALRAGKHLWMEKPMTQTVAQAERLVDEAARRRLTLLVDHTFIYTGAVAKMGELIKGGDLGSILYYDSGPMAHVNVSWLAPVKVRQIMVAGSKKMIAYNDLEPSEKVKVYDKGVHFTDDPTQIREMRIGYRTGDMCAPKLAVTEALRTEGEHFVDCIEHGLVPITDGQLGLRVVRLIEAANESMRRRGEMVHIEPAEALA